ncbi:Bacteriophage CI repressor [uncultured Caudovirales phage]|uniref:Bacteriophage CI repressor n=1 Tax=uncultured Caudovirales phage TaxID=2100421 RepID=A0A6J5RVY5_9CAUD|nr:Bacteriophage CI repressor [uncultured Caudovirales phage]CAB4202604.1 Bacteriophage CI repressor [uncultured Caudovirales phage]
MKTETKQVIERLMELFKVASDVELSAIINVPAQTISSWRNRNSTPFALCVEIALNNNVDLNWLLTGEGEMLKRKPVSKIEELAIDYCVKPVGALEALSHRLEILEHELYEVKQKMRA